MNALPDKLSSVADGEPATPPAAPLPSAPPPIKSDAANAPRLSGTASSASKAPPWRLWLVAAAVLILVAGVGGRLWWNATYFAETDNASVAGHVHPVSSRLGGVILQVKAKDNAEVKAGEPLLVLDPADQQAQIDRLRAQLLQVDALVSGSAAQIAQARAQSAVAQAQTAQSDALLSRATRDVERAQRLASDDVRFISPQALDGASATRDAAQADVAARRATVGAAEQSVRGSLAARESALAQREVLLSQLRDAQQQLAYTTVTAPADGRIGKRTVETGQRVQPGQQLLAVVEEGTWIVANFKETQLAKMSPGQSATVRIDALPGQTLKATVDSFAPASGASFSLLPPDNATGNFTKIVQRVPVKLLIDPAQARALRGRLVPGLSATVSVDLRG